MTNQQLLDYIKKQLESGTSKEQIKNLLLGSGWQEDKIEEVFALLSGQAPTPQTPSSTYFSETLSNQKPKFTLIKILAGIIIIGLVGMSTTLASRIWDPLWNPFRPSPEKVIEEMLKKDKEIKTFLWEIKLDIGAKLDIKEKEKEIFGDSLNLFFDIREETDKEKQNSAIQFNIKLVVPVIDVSLKGESKAIGGDTYLKLTEVPFPLEFIFTMMGIQHKIKNQWIKIDKESLKEIESELSPEEKEIEKKKEEKEEKLIEDIKKLLKNKKLYLVKKEFPDEKIDKKKVYHYLVTLNKEEIKEVLLELREIINEESMIKELGEGIIGESLNELKPKEEKKKTEEEIKKEIEEILEKIGEISAEIWIGKKDYYLYRIKAEKEIEAKIFDPKTEGKLFLKLDINFSKFNQPLKIEPPTEFKNLKEILQPLLDERKKEFPFLPQKETIPLPLKEK